MATAAQALCPCTTSQFQSISDLQNFPQVSSAEFPFMFHCPELQYTLLTSNPAHFSTNYWQEVGMSTMGLKNQDELPLGYFMGSWSPGERLLRQQRSGIGWGMGSGKTKWSQNKPLRVYKPQNPTRFSKYSSNLGSVINPLIILNRSRHSLL